MSEAQTPVLIQRIGRGRAELARFFDVADRIYAGDPNWVAPLRSDLAKVFQDENPFFRHGEIQLFLATRDGAAVGRVAAILDRNHNAFHREKAAFFGFFESIDDSEVAGKLLEAAAVWGRERKMTVLRGPTNPTLNDEAGLLVDGFDSPPVLMMTYNPAPTFRSSKGRVFGRRRICWRTGSRSRRSPSPGSPAWPIGFGSASPTSSSATSRRAGSRSTSPRSARSTTRPGRRTGASSR